MELINKDTLQIKEFISSLDSMLDGIESIVKHYKPHLNGERFLSNLKSATPFPKCYLHKEKWTFDS